jgi:hypothetical protein
MIALIFGHIARWNVDVFVNIPQFNGEYISFASPAFTISESLVIKTPSRDLIFKELSDESLKEIIRQINMTPAEKFAMHALLKKN